MSASDPIPDRRRRIGVGVLVALILAASIGLRLFRLNAKSFWFDEFATVQLVMGHGFSHWSMPHDVLIEDPPKPFDLESARPIHELWFSELQGHMPPLYVVVMRLWGEVFGLGQSSARMFSVLMSVAAVALIFMVVREVSGTMAALWAAAVMAVAGPQIQFAQEARHYTLLLVEALGAAAALARIERRGFNIARGAALALGVLAMALTHYFTIGVILALVAYGLVRTRGRMRMQVIASFAAAGIAWLVVGAPVAWRQMRNIGFDEASGTAFLVDDSPGHLARTALRVALLPARYFTEPMGDAMVVAAIGVFAFPLALLLARRRRDLLLWGLWLWLAIAPIVALDLFRRTQHLEFLRYTLIASPAMYALVAAALSQRRGWSAHAIPLVVVLACIAALPAAYSTWWKADWRALARDIDAHARDGDITLFWQGSGYRMYPSAAFLHTSYYRRHAYGPIVLMSHPPDAALLARLRAAPGVLLVTLTQEPIDDGLPEARFQQKAFHPSAGRLLRVTWPQTSTTRRVTAAPSDHPAAP